MPLNRTPPVSPAVSSKQSPAHHQSEPNISASLELSEVCISDSSNITSRNKRKRDEQDNLLSMNEFKDEISGVIKDLKKEQTRFFSNMETTLQEIKNQYSKLQDSVDFTAKKYDDMLSKMEQYEVERKQNREYIRNLEDRVDQLEKQQKNTCIEIKNIPKTENESQSDLIKAVTNVGSVLDLPITQSDVKDIYRINSKNSMNNTIIVDFTTVLLKSKILKSVRNFNKINKNSKLNTTQLRVPGPQVPVYISDNLPTKARKLFFKAREFALQQKYKHCWSAYGKVYIRKEDGAQRITVNSETDLVNLNEKK